MQLMLRRRALHALLAACSLCWLTGCPTDKQADPQPAPTANAPTTEESSTEELTVSAPPKQRQEPEAPAGKPGELQPRELQLELGGLRLGGSYDSVYEFIHSDGQPRMHGIWSDHKGGTGMLSASPSKGGRLPADDYCFINGICAGYFKRFKLSDEEYVRLVGSMAGIFDPGTVDPPAWAADDPIVKALPKLTGLGGRIFWQDEARGELLVIQREHPSGNGFCALYYPKQVAALGMEYADFTTVFEPEPASNAVVK